MEKKKKTKVTLLDFASVMTDDATATDERTGEKFVARPVPPEGGRDAFEEALAAAYGKIEAGKADGAFRLSEFFDEAGRKVREAHEASGLPWSGRPYAVATFHLATNGALGEAAAEKYLRALV